MLGVSIRLLQHTAIATVRSYRLCPSVSVSSRLQRLWNNSSSPTVSPRMSSSAAANTSMASNAGDEEKREVMLLPLRKAVQEQVGMGRQDEL